MVVKIRGLCTQTGITLAFLERKLGFGNGTIADWDKHRPCVDRVKGVADYFGVTVDELLREDEGGEK